MKRSLPILDLIETARLLERQASMLLADAGLTFPQFRTLLAVGDDKPPTVGALSERLHVTKPYTTNVLRELTRAGLVVLKVHPLDRRSTLVEVTELGRLRVHLARSGLEGMDRALAARIPIATLRVLRTLADPENGGKHHGIEAGSSSRASSRKRFVGTG
ncbi:MAG: MarR family winged helix-turn-helix transcriptional regulator [Acidiferrobacteraceae bacterium]